MLSLALGLALALGAPPASDVASVAILGPTGQARTLTLADLRGLKARDVTATDPHGTQAGTYRAVPLTDLLSLVAAPLGEALRGKALAASVLVEAADGYRVVFSLAELDPGIRDTQAFLAFERDGKPLGADVGPCRLVVPTDKRGARWVRQVVKLSVIDAARP